MATIKEIARLTSVSTATVSNVLNGKSGAAGEEKAREIIAVARKLNFTPNSIAKNLKKRKTNTIAIITEDLTVFNTPEIVDGIESFCEKQGYEIILGNMRLFKRYSNDFTDTPKHHELLNALVRNLLAKQVEGIIYIGYHCREIQWLVMMLQSCLLKKAINLSALFADRLRVIILTRGSRAFSRRFLIIIFFIIRGMCVTATGNVFRDTVYQGS